MDVWFEYYRENGGYLEDIDMFERFFVKMATERPIFTKPDGSHITANYETAVHRLFWYYDQKFYG